MDEQMIHQLAHELRLSKPAVAKVLQLVSEGNTVPFIARYRKEQTGGLDEVAIRAIEKQWQSMQQIEKRREQVTRLIAEQGLLTPALAEQLEKAQRLLEIDDLYLPFQQKRQTKATAAIALGLEPLAKSIMAQNLTWEQLQTRAKTFCRAELPDVATVFQQTQAIIAQWLSERRDVRQAVRMYCGQTGELVAKQKPKSSDPKQTFQMYYAYRQAVRNIPNHQVLALNRGEKLGVLTVKLAIDEPNLHARVESRFLKTNDRALQAYMRTCFQDALKRLLLPSLERELRQTLSQRAQTQAITLFSQNVQQLLLQPPLKGQTILGLDPAFRTGCKLAVIDAQGDVLAIDVIYPHQPQNQREQASKKILTLIEQYHVNLIAIGNGTASRESEEFIAATLQAANAKIPYLIVSEAGASVYSASPQARSEFPSLQVEQRSAISIARRVLDPLAELVKIDPQALGVGQYQHDLPTTQLREELQAVVESAVNQVGVELNTASASLLAYVSGLNANVAQQIVAYRQTNGAFTSRQELKNVPRLGPKTFEQAAGFLRIQAATNRFDQTPIHPESYPLAKRVLTHLGYTPADLGSEQLQAAIAACEVAALSTQLQAGEATLSDILEAFCAPNRDPREQYPQPLLRHDVLTLADLAIGMQLQGTVRNIVDFGAFVDIGLKTAGLIHKSAFGTYVNHPLDIISLNEIVNVEIIALDPVRETIGLRYLKPTR